MWYLWGLVNSFGILTHLPLIKIKFPLNMQMFMSFLLEISNFDILPTDFISESLLEFTPTDPLNTEFYEVDIF